MEAQFEDDTEKSGGKKTIVPGVKREDDGVNAFGMHISSLRMPLVGMFVSATVLLVAVLTYKQSMMRWREYSISVPAVTMGMSFISIAMTSKASFYDKYGKFVNYFLFVWSLVGALMLTFVDPFTGTGNGYFACWVMMACSAAALGAGLTASAVRGMGALMGLLASSVVVTIAIFPTLGRNDTFYFASVYTVCVSSVTLASILIHMAVEKKRGIENHSGIAQIIVLALVAAMWLALAGITTFRGPFLVTGNGYFGSWAGAACACSAVMAARKERKQQNN